MTTKYYLEIEYSEGRGCAEYKFLWNHPCDSLEDVKKLANRNKYSHFEGWIHECKRGIMTPIFHRRQWYYEEKRGGWDEWKDKTKTR